VARCGAIGGIGRATYSAARKTPNTNHKIGNMTVFTIGYEGLDIGTFMSALENNGVKTVIDVRELPLSRKRGFSKKALARSLNFSGYGYIHMAELGCPKPVRHRFRADGDWERYIDSYLEHLRFQQADVTQLAELIRSVSCALLCYEADHNLCHRSIVANAVAELCGARIRHINAGEFRTKTSAPHRDVFA